MNYLTVGVVTAGGTWEGDGGVPPPQPTRGSRGASTRGSGGAL